jgi:hypothetical protein
MRIGKVKRKIIKPDVIPVTLPKPASIPAPDVFTKKPVSVPR